MSDMSANPPTGGGGGGTGVPRYLIFDYLGGVISDI